MGKSLKSDPFVLAVAEIAANERAKYFFEWLAQARIDVVASVREAGYSAESASRAAAQSELLDSLLNSIAEAGEIAGADVSVCVAAFEAAVARTDAGMSELSGSANDKNPRVWHP